MPEVPVAQVLAPRFVQLSTKRPHLEVQRQGLIAYLPCIRVPRHTQRPRSSTSEGNASISCLLSITSAAAVRTWKCSGS